SPLLSSLCQINFQKDCGSDNRCTSNLQLKATCASEKFIPFPWWAHTRTHTHTHTHTHAHAHTHTHTQAHYTHTHTHTHTFRSNLILNVPLTFAGCICSLKQCNTNSPFPSFL